jgi:hypothetical protein
MRIDPPGGKAGAAGAALRPAASKSHAKPIAATTIFFIISYARVKVARTHVNANER